MLHGKRQQYITEIYLRYSLVSFRSYDEDFTENPTRTQVRTAPNPNLQAFLQPYSHAKFP